MAWQGLAAEFLQVPVVTRAYTAACVLTTAAVVSRPGGWGVTIVTGRREGRHGYGWMGAAPDVSLVPQQLELLSPFQLYFNPHLVFRKLQVRPPHPCT